MSDPMQYDPNKQAKAVLHQPTPKYLQKLAKKSREFNQKRLNDAYRAEEIEEEATKVQIDQLLMEIREKQKEELEKQKKSRYHGDIYNILVGIFMMDGPFLVLRLIMIFQFGVTTDLHLLFTGKNAIGASLLVYRLLILTFGH